MNNVWLSQASPWLLAQQRYLATLTTEEEKKLFTYASLENLFYTTSVAQNDHQENSKSRAAMEKLRPFLQAIEDYGKALDVFSNASSAILCPLWGSIRVVLHVKFPVPPHPSPFAVASEFDKYFDRLVEMLVTIGDYLPGMRVYEKIFTGHPDLLQSLSEVYLDIITFCMEANKVLKEIKEAKVWSAIQVPLWKSFDKKFSVVVNNFQRHKTNVERGASISHMIEAAGERTNAQLQRTELNAIQKGLRQAQLLQYLSSVDHRYRHHQLRKKRHNDTGNWIFVSEKFKEWTKHTGSCLLWCYGIPGSGKTIITTTVIDELSTNPAYDSSAIATCIVYFYCDYSNQKTLEASEIFGSFIKQLLFKSGISDEIQSELISTYQDGISKPDSEDLLNILLSVLKTFDSVFFVLDGIDECRGNDRVELLLGIQSIVKSGSAIVKFFLASRADVDLERAFSNHIHLPISTNDITADIVAFVNGIVDTKIQSRDLVVRNSSLASEIVDALVKGAQGMFIWVTFQIDDICDEDTDDGIRRVLRSLPIGLAATYQRALQKIKKREATMAQKIFKWMVCAKRPLSIDEIKEAISIAPLDKYLDQDRVTTDDSRILRACANLVVFDSDEGNFRFAHYSVQEFLLSDPADIYVPNIQFKLSDAEHEVGEICVTYLSFDHFKRQIARQEIKEASIITDFSLLGSTFLGESYLGWCGKFLFDGWARLRGLKTSQPKISINWGEYLKHARVAPTRDFEKQYRLLNYIIENWVWHTLEFSITNTEPQIWATFIALALGQDLPFSFRPWGDVNKTSDFPQMSLVLWALDVGHATFLRLLLEPAEGPDLRTYLAQEVEEGTPLLLNVALHRSAQKGHVDMVELLLKNGADHKSTSGTGDRALHHASSNGHDAVVKILLKAGADHKSTNNTGDRALHHASSNGHDAVVKILLKAGADPNARNNTGDRALDHASSNGHDTVVKILLKAGADHKSTNNKGDRALHHASSNGQDVVVKILLKAGADPNAGNYFNDTPLHVAALNGNVTTVKLLLGGKAGLRMGNDSGSTALYQAAYGGHRAVVKFLMGFGLDGVAEFLEGSRKGHSTTVELLLEHGVGQNARDRGLKDKALILAARGGHDKVVSLLLSRHADPDTKEDHSGDTALHIAASLGHGEVIRALLKTRAYRMAKNNHGSTPFEEAINSKHNIAAKLLVEDGVDGTADLHRACQERDDLKVRFLVQCGVDETAELRLAYQEGDGTMVRLLIESGVDGAAKLHRVCQEGNDKAVGLLIESGVDGTVELHRACQEGNSTVLTLLLGHKVNPNAITNDSDITALHKAASMGHDAVVKLLLDHKVNPDAKINSSGRTALHEAAHGGHDAVVKLLLDYKVDPDTKINSSGRTALHEAAHGGHDAVIKLLLDYHADWNANDRFGYTALYIAALEGHIKAIKSMLEFGVNGAAYLVKACQEGNITVAKSLVESGINPNSKAVGGTNTPLHLAARYGYDVIVEVLLKFGADHTTRDLIGDTPLSDAALEGQDATAKLLLESGADHSIKNKNGETPLHYAVSNGHNTLVKLLLENGADQNVKDEAGQTPLERAIERRHNTIVVLLQNWTRDHARKSSEEISIRAATYEEAINLSHNPEAEHSETDNESFYSMVSSEHLFMIRPPTENNVGETLEPHYPSRKENTALDLPPRHDLSQNSSSSNLNTGYSSSEHRSDLTAGDERGGRDGGGRRGRGGGREWREWREWGNWRNWRSGRNRSARTRS